MIRLLLICILLNTTLCSGIPDEFCKHKYFDSIYWNGFSYKITRNRDNNSYHEWTVYYDKYTKSFHGYDYKLFGK